VSIADPLIIYLAIGSPFAVHHFLKYRPAFSFREVFRTILVWLFWPAYAVWLLTHSKTPGTSRISYSPDYIPLDAASAKRVDELRSEMERLVCRNMEQSILDFREVFERYVGLTTETLAEPMRTASPFAEMTMNGEENAKLNAICLNRRNRRQLEFHQIRARNDFLEFAAAMSDGIENSEFEHLAIELSTLLLDSEGLEALKINQIVAGQTEAEPSVIDLESEVWPSKAHRQSIVGRA